MVLMTVMSSMHLLMKPVTDAVYSSRSVEPLVVAASLNICQSVHSKQSWRAEMAPSGQVFTCLLAGHERLTSGLYVGDVV